MTMIWPMEPTVAPSDFSPFTKEVAMPVTVRDASTRVRAASGGGALTRPARRNLLELGLACGQGADALEAKAATADVAARMADRAAGVDRAGTAEKAGEDEAAGGRPEPAAIAAMATEIREIGRKRDRLAEELAGLDRQREEVQAKLMALLGKAGVRMKPTAPEPPALPPGTGLPTHRWNRTD
jgi:hypothetical protein